jgi:hypothetical protein
MSEQPTPAEPLPHAGLPESNGAPPAAEPEAMPAASAEPAPAAEPSFATPDREAPQVAPEPPVRARPSARGPARPGLMSATAVPIEDIEPDEQFRLREVGDVAGLATSMARVGQLFAIDVRPRGGSFQVVSGFRRLAALKFLQRGTVLARVHAGMTDAEAWVFALAQALETRALSPEEIAAVRDRLAEVGQLSSMTRGLIDAALTVPGSDLEPEDLNAAAQPEEVDLDELAADLEARLVGISADLSLVTDLWSQLDAEPRAKLLEQLRYYGELHAYLSRLR